MTGWSAEMETHHQGARNAGRPMLLEGGLDWKPMGFSPSDMEFHETKQAAAREIAIAFGVPPMLMGIPGDATYANYQEANRAFYRLTVLPWRSGCWRRCRIGWRSSPARRWSCGPIWTRSRRWRWSATSNGRGSARPIS
jgi:phage portal protein BeeE